MPALKAHFLNVGHGDCTVLQHPSGRVTVIDIHNGTELDDDSEKEILSELQWPDTVLGFIQQGRLSKNELLEKAGYNIPRTNPVEYVKVNLGAGKLWRFILTHPEMDHMRGFAALRSTLGFDNLWDTENTKKNKTFHPFLDDETDWKDYQKVRGGTDPKVLNLYRGSTGSYWSEGGPDALGDQIEILAPTPDLVKYANENEKWNELSYVLRVQHGGRSIILGGDACKTAWDSIVEHYGSSLKCDILKASHHGRESGFHKEAVEFMSPQLTVLSVGKKPETDHHQEYNKYSDHVWSTRWKGNVVVTIGEDGEMTADSQYNRNPLSTKPQAA